jgi:hypothetical protein
VRAAASTRRACGDVAAGGANFFLKHSAPNVPTGARKPSQAIEAVQEKDEPSFYSMFGVRLSLVSLVFEQS